MSADEQLHDLDEIEHALRDDSSGLRESIVRDIGSFTVALLTVSQVSGSDRLDLGGTGTLVRVGTEACILTALHVWEKRLKAAARIGITLKENVDHKYLIDPKVITPIGPDKPQVWNEWGPDFVFLRIPQEIAAEVEAIGHGVFYNLAKDRGLKSNRYCLALRLLMGTPRESGEITDKHADLQITGMFCDTCNGRFSSLHLPGAIRYEYDYLDQDTDIASPGIPQNFGGVSGGGLWRVLVYKSAETGQAEWAKGLEGMAFYQSDIIAGRRAVRCHGPQSIGTGVRILLQ